MTMVGVTMVEGVQSGQILAVSQRQSCVFVGDGLDVGYKRKKSSVMTGVLNVSNW